MSLPPLVILWAHPRSLSTAFERMMMQRGDYFVVHEPFCTVTDTGSFLPTDSEDGVPLTGYEAVVDYLLALSQRRPVFVKETTEYSYSVVLGRTDFLESAAHCMMIRNPELTIPSHHAMNPKVSLGELGYGNLLQIRQRLLELGAEVRAVLDADTLQEDPVSSVEQFCSDVGIPFVAEAMTWQSANPEEWSRTAHWHVAAAQSQGFQRKAETKDRASVHSSPHLRELWEQSLPLYERLRNLCRTPTET